MDFTVPTSKHQEMVDITKQVSDLISKSKIKEGFCNVFTLHTTAAIVINENWDPNIIDDFFKAMNKAIPQHDGYKHDSVDGNAQSHILSAIIGPSETIPVRDGKLLLGRWQSLMLVELDGPKKREVVVTFSEKA